MTKEKWISKNCKSCGYKIETTIKDYLKNGCRNCGKIYTEIEKITNYGVIKLHKKLT